MKRKYQEGGGWRTGMMKSRMATEAALGNPAAIRMTQLYPQTYTFTGQEGRTSREPAGATGTHYMSSMGEYAVPYIQDKNGKLIYNKKASFRDKEAMRFNSPQEAEYFAEHYKEVAPMMRENKQKGGKAKIPQGLPGVDRRYIPEPATMRSGQPIEKEGFFDYIGHKFRGDLTPQTEAALTKKYAKPVVNAVRVASAAGQFVPHPLVRYPSMAVNSLLGATDAYEDYQRGDKAAAAKDILFALPLPMMKAKVPGMFEKAMQLPRPAANYNAFVTGLNVLGAGDDIIQSEQNKYGGMKRKYGDGGVMQSLAPNRHGKYEYVHEDRYKNQTVVHKGDRPISQQYFDNLVEHSRALPYIPQATGAVIPSHPIRDVPYMAPQYADEPQTFPIAMNRPIQKNGGFWNGEKWVRGGDSGTYANGIYFKNGGPTFPVGGSAPLFGMGGVTDEEGDYVYPFAMYPGTGRGKGMLQDLPTHMANGGPIPGAQLVNPFAMNPGTGRGTGMLQQYVKEKMGMGGKPCLECGGHMGMHHVNAGPYEYGGASSYGMGGGYGCASDLNNYQGQYGGIADSDGDSDYMKKGGHWIQGAVNPAHKGYCTPMTKSTCTPRRKAFAMTMKKHHGFHEYGGEVTNGGNMVADNELYAYGGGYGNPYHPLKRFMQDGGVDPWGSGGGAFGQPAGTPPPEVQQGRDIEERKVEEQTGMKSMEENTFGQPKPMVSGERANMNEQPVEGAENLNDPYNQQPADEDTSGGNRNKGWGWGVLGAGMAALGAGAAIAGAYADRRDQRNLRNKQFNDRMSSNVYAAQNQPGGKGDWDQYGNFRPNQNTPTRPGTFYPGQGAAKFGGNFAQRYAHGGYHAGQEVEMSDAEIARLRKLGYKIDII